MMNPSDEQIEEQVEKAKESHRDHPERLSGMSYEEGVEAALEWVLTPDATEPPMEDE